MRPARPNRRYQAALFIDRRLGPALCAALYLIRRLRRRRRWAASLFGSETPTSYAPLHSRAGQRHEIHYVGLACSPCLFVHDDKVPSCWFTRARCMTEIRTADVYASVSGLLAASVGAPAASTRLGRIDP